MNTEQTHTAGPYTLMPSKKSGLFHIETASDAPKAGIHIASVTHEATGVLLASAPEMLQALTECEFILWSYKDLILKSAGHNVNDLHKKVRGLSQASGSNVQPVAVEHIPQERAQQYADKIVDLGREKADLQALNAELLEALKDISTSVQRDVNIGSDPKYYELLESWQKVKSAIAKAEGKQPESKINQVEAAKNTLQASGYILGSLFELGDIIARSKENFGNEGALNEEQAREVAAIIDARFDASQGINWDAIDSAINEWQDSK